jgi:hypothetical protein
MKVVPIVAAAVALAGCSPPPLPAAQSARGATGASISLPPHPARIVAKLQATSAAEVKEGGWVELRIYANERECTKDQVARQGPMGPAFNVLLVCEAEVPASTPFTFRAEQEGRDASTREVTIQARYEYPPRQ